MVVCAVSKSEPKSEMSVHSNIISGATDGLVYARNGPLRQVGFIATRIVFKAN
jgi:hypothetical protein